MYPPSLFTGHGRTLGNEGRRDSPGPHATILTIEQGLPCQLLVLTSAVSAQALPPREGAGTKELNPLKAEGPGRASSLPAVEQQLGPEHGRCLTALGNPAKQEVRENTISN